MTIRAGKPTLVSRLGSDWLFRLPGKGRQPLLQPLLVKLGRSVRSGDEP